MSKSICKAFKANKNDELYTPRILVECLKPYFEEWALRFEQNRNSIKHMIKPDYTIDVLPTIWAPFDKDTSEFAIFFRELGYTVVCSHIDVGQDFFNYEPENYDIIISNPPFSRKLDVFKRCNDLKKPWVMLANSMCINYMEIGNYFADNPVQMLCPDKRVSFDGNPSSFVTVYFCSKFLTKDLLFCHLPHCNTGKNFIPSRMY